MSRASARRPLPTPAINAARYAERERTVTRAMMTSDADWPNLVLPLKSRRERDPSGAVPLCGCLYNPVNEAAPLTIHLHTMFDTGDRVRNAATREYPSVDAAIADGWVVD
jgi:hypothetical protein